MASFTVADLDKDWPLQGLESVLACPYCGAAGKTLAYRDVRDWSFGCAAGRWSYWDCDACSALYLDPRPTPAALGNAYGSYYTHGDAAKTHLFAALKHRLKNEYLSALFARRINPGLGLPGWAAPFVKRLRPWVAEPFGMRQLAELPGGLLIDVGCGNGNMLKLARQSGWQTLGIELDAAAVAVARAQGLDVIQGGYEELARYEGKAGCIICSHVLEHVHHPLQLLKMLLASLAPGGVLLLSAPNAASYIRDHYAENWRGLEAPRHLAIPDAGWLMAWLGEHGMACTQVPSHDKVMMIESERIKRRGSKTVPADVKAARTLALMKKSASLQTQDIVQIVCGKTKP